LLQTHPGSLRSGKRSRLVCSSSNERDPRQSRSSDITSLTALIDKPALRQARRPIRPRPNALPLHDVRYRTTRGSEDRKSFPSTASAVLHASRRPWRRKAKLMLHRIFLQNFRKPRQFAAAHKDGGARRDRTDDLMLAKHALSQLSYGPVSVGRPPADIPRVSSAAHSGLANLRFA
jgi:hypothetical protein